MGWKVRTLPAEWPPWSATLGPCTTLHECCRLFDTLLSFCAPGALQMLTAGGSTLSSVTTCMYMRRPRSRFEYMIINMLRTFTFITKSAK